MNVLIIDSSIRVIERLEVIISEAEIFTVIHKAVSNEEAKKLLRENKYDAVLLDIGLLGDESLKLLKEIRETCGHASVIVLSIHIDNYIREQCKSNGADFIFDKYCEFEKICGVIVSIGKLVGKLESTRSEGFTGY